MPAKEWRRRSPPPVGFARSLGLPPFHAHLLYNRGIRRREDIESYLAGDSRLAHNPLTLPDMDKAVARLQKAVADGEVIGVFGDFDTDGLTGTALLVQALQELGARAVPYLPDRVDEGHGLNTDAVEFLGAQGVSLMVTVDCGISSVEEVKLASSIGIDTIVTDHHSVPTSLPEGVALINPRRPGSTYPYQGLTGAGLSFKLVEALWAAQGRSRPEHLLGLAALGTVADVGPLTGENRYLVKRGLQELNENSNAGLSALISRARLKPGSLDTDSLSFGLIPRLNAAGRLGRASMSLNLLTATSSETAAPIAEALERQNEERRRLTKDGLAEAHRQLEAQFERLPPLVVVEHGDWLPGILGVIAGSLSEHLYRPVIAVSIGEQVSRGSARSIPEFDIVEALRKSRDLLHRFGGHPRAAGFTLSTGDLPRLKSELLIVADEKLQNMDLVPSIDIDCEISPALLDAQNYSFIQSLSPYGEENPAPVFLTRNARVAEARKVGRRQDHLKMRIAHSGRTWDAIAFRQGDSAIAPGDSVDLVYTVGMDDWGDQPTLQLNVLDFRPGR